MRACTHTHDCHNDLVVVVVPSSSSLGLSSDSEPEAVTPSVGVAGCVLANTVVVTIASTDSDDDAQKPVVVPRNTNSNVYHFCNKATLRCAVMGCTFAIDPTKAKDITALFGQHLRNPVPVKNKKQFSPHGYTREYIANPAHWILGRKASTTSTPFTIAAAVAASKADKMKPYLLTDVKQVAYVGACVDFITLAGAPLATVENELFRHLVSTLDPRIVPMSRRALGKRINEKVTSLYCYITQILALSPAVHLSVDGWSSRLAISFMGIVANVIVMGVPLTIVLHIREVNAASKTAIVQAALLKQVISDWSLQDKQLTISSDCAGVCESLPRVTIIIDSSTTLNHILVIATIYYPIVN